jgi:hypothetical protein
VAQYEFVSVWLFDAPIQTVWAQFGDEVRGGEAASAPGADAVNQNMHRAGDTLSTIHYDLALDIVRMNLVFVADALGWAGATGAA